MSQTLPGHLLDELRPPSNTFVETGTNTGGAVRLALAHGYSRVLTCELDDGYYKAAVESFKDDPRVELHYGDSAVMLPEMVRSLYSPCLLWLDGHNHEPGRAIAPTGKCPLAHELKALANAPRRDHTIMIDDIDEAGSSYHEFPSHDAILDLLFQINHNYRISYRDQKPGHRPNAILIASL